MTATQRPNAAATPIAATNGEPAMIRILIADDHAIVRAGLKQFIVGEGDIQVAGEASTGAETIELVRNGEFDIVLLDIGMPDGSGIDTLRKLKTLRPDLPVLMLSGFAEEQYALNLLRAGAAGYVTKEAAPADLVKAIRTVRIGRKYVSPELAQILAAGVSGETDKPLHAQLSQREFQIFCKLAAGESVSKIADELLISVKTVSTYRTRVLEKMNLSSNADITYYAIKNGLIQ
jgi:two-component system, NarL family, invasion response regulator UvrY